MSLSCGAVREATRTNGGLSSPSSGGCKRHCNGKMAAWLRAIAAARKAQRSPRCSPTCSCTMRSIAGCSGSIRTSASSGTAMTWSCTAASEAQAPPGAGTRSRGGWPNAEGCSCVPRRPALSTARTAPRRGPYRARLIRVLRGPDSRVRKVRARRGDYFFGFNPGHQRRGGQAHPGADPAPGGCACAVDGA